MTRKDSSRAIAADLCRLDVGEVRTGVDLRLYSQWRCGGPADLLVAPRNASEVAHLLSYFHERSIPWAVIGGGSNLFFHDHGVRVPLIHIGRPLGEIRVSGDRDRLHAEAGAWAPRVALTAMRAGLGGIEHTIGIPGAFGGLVLMNGGSLRQGVGENVLTVDIVDADGQRRHLNRKQCGFAYRRSQLQGRKCVVVGATLQLKPRDPALMRRRMIEIMASRRKRFPRDMPNCGSVFVSDPALFASFGPPGAVIESCGLKGARVGDAMVSSRHANFIVNLGAARAEDIMALIAHVREAVAARTGRHMRCEVRFMNCDGEVREAHEWFAPEQAPLPAPESVETLHG